MADIVDRLRNYDTCHDGDVDEAADEIERLREENAHYRELFHRVVICCENLDHRHGEYHDAKTPCPVVEKFVQFLPELRTT